MLDSGAAVPRSYERRTAKMDLSECPQCKFQGVASVHWRAPRFLRCRECGTIFRDPFPGESELANYYREGWKEPEEINDIVSFARWMKLFDVRKINRLDSKSKGMENW